jgi:hypothetical protein
MFIWALVCLPESKGRKFEGLDILFESKISAGKFASNPNFQALI